MSYAVRNDGLGWRAIGSVDELMPGETFAVDAPDASFEQAKDIRRHQIRAAYETAAGLGVSAQGTIWNGGFDSAIKLDAAKRLAEAAGASEVVLFDLDNEPHQLDMATAQIVVMAVASAFQLALAQKQQLIRAIDSAATPAELELVVWP